MRNLVIKILLLIFIGFFVNIILFLLLSPDDTSSTVSLNGKIISIAPFLLYFIFYILQMLTVYKKLINSHLLILTCWAIAISLFDSFFFTSSMEQYFLTKFKDNWDIIQLAISILISILLVYLLDFIYKRFL